MLDLREIPTGKSYVLTFALHVEATLAVNAGREDKWASDLRKKKG
jgi:hypothetical protein